MLITFIQCYNFITLYYRIHQTKLTIILQLFILVYYSLTFFLAKILVKVHHLEFGQSGRYRTSPCINNTKPLVWLVAPPTAMPLTNPIHSPLFSSDNKRRPVAPWQGQLPGPIFGAVEKLLESVVFITAGGRAPITAGRGASRMLRGLMLDVKKTFSFFKNIFKI